MAINAKTLSETELFYGHKACAGCGGSLAVRIALKVLGENAVAVLPAGCMSAVGFNFPQLCFGNNAIISTFAGTASMLTGVEAGLRAQGITDFHAVGFAGDGGTADIGLQALSGAIDRNDDIRSLYEHGYPKKLADAFWRKDDHHSRRQKHPRQPQTQEESF